MSKTSKAGTAASSAYGAARSNEYVQRLIEDEDLRDNLRDAYDSARSAYDRVSGNRKGPVKAVASDKKAQKELRSAAETLRVASDQLRGVQKKKRHPFRKLLVLGAVGGAVTLAMSENARKALMDTLFGAEEEFEYTSTTSGNGTAASTTPTPAATETPDAE